MSPDLAVLTDSLARSRQQLDRQYGEMTALAHQHHELKDQIVELRAEADLYERAAAVLTAIGEQRQDDAQRRIESLVTLGLQTIFGEELTFHLVSGIRAKIPVVDFVVRSHLDDGSIVETEVMDARGGGLAATVGFLLRLVILLLSAQRQDTVLFLDETFAHVSAEYLPRLTEFLKELVLRTGVQVVMVTHEDAFQEAADVVYRFTLRDGVTGVQRL